MREKTLSKKSVFDGQLLHVEVLEVELEEGRRSVREIVRHPGAAVILPRLPDGRFVFVRQFRKPVEKEMLEAVAGTLHDGEAPDDCAVRELREETGYRARVMRKMGVVYPAPGYTDETLHLYFADLLPDREAMNPDEDEKLDVIFLTPDRVEELIRTGELCDAKTLAAWVLYHASATEGKKSRRRS